MQQIDQHDQDYLLEPMTDEEAREYFDRAARYYLNMSGDEFVRRYDAGEYDDDPDQHGIMDMILSLPLIDHPFRPL
jgi:hypothetical protein